MRIGLIIDTFNLGGAETMVFETARLLKQHGETPVLLHFGSQYIIDFAAKNAIEQQLIPNRKLYKKTLLLPLFALKTARFIQSLKLDCLHSHLFGPIIAFAPLAWLIGLPHIGTLHDEYMIEEAPKRIWLIKLARAFKTQLVAVSKPMMAFYNNAAKFKPGAVIYIPNFSPPNDHLSQKQQVRKALKLNDNDVAIFSVGRLVELKRFNILIEAISRLKQHPQIKAFIVGNGPEQKKLEALIAKYNIASQVSLLGERSDVTKLLSAADIFTLTSETEGMSKSILEALAAGLPVIATNVGGNKDLVLNDHNGCLLADHTPETLSAQILALAENAALRETMGKNSLQLIRQEYNPELFLQRHLEIYQHLKSK